MDSLPTFAQIAPVVASTSPVVILGGLFFAAIPPTAVAFLAYLQARDSAKISAATAATAKTTAEGVDKIHVAVNSERTAMLDELKKLKDEIARLITDKAVVAETQRGIDKAADVETQRVTTAAPPQINITTQQLAEALKLLGFERELDRRPTVQIPSQTTNRI